MNSAKRCERDPEAKLAGVGLVFIGACAFRKQHILIEVVFEVFSFDHVFSRSFEIVRDDAAALENNAVLNNQLWRFDITKNFCRRQQHHAAFRGDVTDDDTLDEYRVSGYAGLDFAGCADIKLICLQCTAFELTVDLEAAVDIESARKIRVCPDG